MKMAMSPLRRRQAIVFGIGWIGYAGTFLLRKPLGVIKADMEKELSFTKTQLGWLDTALLLPYAVMQMTLGPVGDYLGPRKTYGGGLIFAAFSMMSFGHWSNFYIYFALLFLNGTAQGQCWPSCSKALGSWFPVSVRNSVFGLFGTCAFCGGIAGTWIAVYLQTTYGWRSVHFAPSIFVGVVGVIVLLFWKSPEEVNMEVPGSQKSTSSGPAGKKLSWFKMWTIPVVGEIAVAMFCLKIVRYCMYMWLPMYLLHYLKYTKAQAGMYSTTFEIGGIVGSAFLGVAIDKFFRGRTLMGCLVSALLSTLALVLFTVTSSWGILFNSAFMFMAGIFNCGPDMILGGSVPAELGELDNRQSAAAVVGLVNGFGSLGTFFEGPVVGLITSYYGWSEMFYLLIALSLAGSLAVFRGAQVYAKKVLPTNDPVLNI